MNKKAPNPNRESAQKLAGRIAAMSDEQRAELAASMPVVVSVTGHILSPRNTCLAVTQIPTATVMGGFRQWLAAGRCVRKGEHAAYISAPAMRKNEAGEESGFFILVPVFDVSQTEAVAQQVAA
jgi:hypothetical protein